MAVHPRRLSQLIETIYDAAIEPALFEPALVQIVALFDAAAAGLYYRHIGRGAEQFVAAVGVTPDYLDSYQRDHAAENPLSHGYLLFRDCEPITWPMILDEAEFHATRFWRDWVVPQRWHSNLTTVLERGATAFHACTLMAGPPRRQFDEDDRAMMSLVAPHLRQALKIGGLLNQARNEAATLGETLDKLALGAIVVDRQSRVLHANVAAAAALHACAVLSCNGGRLRAVDAGAHARLSTALTRCAENGAPGDIALPAAGGEGGLVAHILPLDGSRRRQDLPVETQAVLFFMSPEPRAEPPMRALADRYGLTGSEARVLRRLLDGDDVKAAAERLDIAVSTLRTHLHRLFEKTGTDSQGNLLRLVSALIPEVAAGARRCDS